MLFVDEAGQVSLGNLVAMATAAKSVVLVGDQMQLAQPIQGAHPRDSGRSALDHLLEGHAVVPPERGIFLSRTWRMHPDLCRSSPPPSTTASSSPRRAAPTSASCSGRERIRR